MPDQLRKKQEADTEALAPDVAPTARNWIVRKYGLKVLAEVGRMRQDPQHAATDVRNLLAMAYEAVSATEIRSREAAASLPCDSSAIRDFADEESSGER